MVYDLLDISDSDHWKYTAVTNEGNQKLKEVIIGENDPMWVGLRHKHVAETIQAILSYFNEFLKENKVQKLLGKQIDSLKDMADAMKRMPQYQEMINKYSLHVNLTGACMSAYTAAEVAKLAAVEQDMATGFDAKSNEVKNQNIVSQLPELLSNPIVSNEDKIRLLMMYIVSQEGIQEKHRTDLVNLAKLKLEDQAAIVNLKYLGVTLLKSIDKKNKTKKEKDKKQKPRDDAPPYELSRYSPELKFILDDLVNGKLSNEKFPFCKEGSDSNNNNSSKEEKGVSMRSKTVHATWGTKEKKKKEEKTVTTSGPRVIVFIAGGATFSEMRTIYEISEAYKKEVILGTTKPLTPKGYVEEMKKLQKMESVL